MHIRRIAADEIEALTVLLNRAYAEHAARGIHMLATHQGPEITRKRIEGRECFVGVVDEHLVATVTLVPPHGGQSVEAAGCATYARPAVAKINQLRSIPNTVAEGMRLP